MMLQLQRLADGKVVVILEGGYNVALIKDCAEAVLRALLGQAHAAALPEKSKPLKQSTDKMLRQVAAVQGAHWPRLRDPVYLEELDRFLQARGRPTGRRQWGCRVGGCGAAGRAGFRQIVAAEPFKTHNPTPQF